MSPTATIDGTTCTLLDMHHNDDGLADCLVVAMDGQTVYVHRALDSSGWVIMGAPGQPDRAVSVVL